MINQPRSALARADQAISSALIITRRALEDLELAGKASGHTGDDLRALIKCLSQACGALGFAGNSQQKLIDAARGAITYNTLPKPIVNELREAIEHASGPGID